ncbi:YhfC family intramembrane metalloprotease [Paenibacillus aurantius]|uniref:YhfC family intramembrane metalloprotease n=1 Tax=Paenibacillus aurantius TaxID=2918900 RepID=A0AA96RGC5_9BACL|nr:YhfC family intramembrane metalloprotease [Paenibacillus aurantius]WNQ12178.1 YhfC family intramembrane metalloprotease [Paenibacillus aurantius]
MVPTSAFAGMIVQGVLAVLIPLIAILYYYRKEKFSFVPFAVGAAVFLVFSQVLEKLLHLYVMTGNPVTMEWLKAPLVLAVYGALAAALFEEGGRWIGMKLLMPRRREWKDGLSFGLGHGGIEALLISGLASVQYLLYATLLNNGTFDEVLGSKLPAEAATQLKTALTDSGFGLYLVGGLERIPALFLQIAMSLMVLYAVRSGRLAMLLWAIVLHAGVDFFPGLYQAKVLPLWLVEILVWLTLPLSLYLIRRSRVWFGEAERRPDASFTGVGR